MIKSKNLWGFSRISSVPNSFRHCNVMRHRRLASSKSPGQPSMKRWLGLSGSGASTVTAVLLLATPWSSTPATVALPLSAVAAVVDGAVSSDNTGEGAAPVTGSTTSCLPLLPSMLAVAGTTGRSPSDKEAPRNAVVKAPGLLSVPSTVAGILTCLALCVGGSAWGVECGVSEEHLDDDDDDYDDAASWGKMACRYALPARCWTHTTHNLGGFEASRRRVVCVHLDNFEKGTVRLRWEKGRERSGSIVAASVIAKQPPTMYTKLWIHHGHSRKVPPPFLSHSLALPHPESRGDKKAGWPGPWRCLLINNTMKGAGATLGQAGSTAKDSGGSSSSSSSSFPNNMADDEEEAAAVMGLREEVVREAKKRGTPQDVEGTALKLLSQQQRESSWLRQEKASLLAQLERARREAADLQGQLSGSAPETQVQALLDSRLLSTRLSLRDTEQAKAVVDLIRAIHSFGTGSSSSSSGITATLEQVQATEGKRNLNRALRCLVMENHCRVNSCIAEVVKFTDRQHQQQHEAAGPGTGVEPPNIQMVFIEGESLIFRIMDMRLQPRDVYMLCSLDEAWPRGGGSWGLKSLFAVSDTPVLFSTPFQLRLDAAARGPQGMLCPEWVSSVDATTPRGEAVIPPSYRARIKDNSTFVYAPLRESAKELLLSSDMEPFEGLALAFLERVRKLDLMLVSYEGPAEVKVVRNVQHEVELQPVRLPGEGEVVESSRLRALKASVRVVAHRVADCLVRCSKTTRIPDRNYQDDGDGPVERRYRLHEFQVALEDSKGAGKAATTTTTTTRIALAFPLGSDGLPLPKGQRRKENDGRLHTESLYCQMPVPYAGKLPFALQADFDVTSDMLGLHPTSGWNHWLLSCTARLFVLAFLADPTLRGAVEHYAPCAEEMPAGGLWHGVRETLERLLQSHVLVRTESGLMVARAQIVLRPAVIGRDFISDELLREVTGGRKHFAEAADAGPASVGGGEGDGEGDERRACSLETVLKCVEKLVAANKWRGDTAALPQLWAYVAGEMARSAGVVSPASMELLQEKLPIYPVQGRAELRRFKHGEVPLFLSVAPELEAVLQGQDSQLRALLVPTLDLARLRSSRGPGAMAALEDALRVVGARMATVESLQPVIRRILRQEQAPPTGSPSSSSARQPATALDADRFWAVRSLVVEGLGFASLREFLGDKAPLSVPVLDLRPGGELGPRLVRVEQLEDVSERFVLPSFLGVALAATAKKGPVLLQAAASWEQVPKGRRGGGVLQAPAAAMQSWNALVRWEACVAKELGVDGGSNRNWQGLFEGVLSPAELADGVMKGLTAPGTTAEGRRAFAKLLESYQEQHAQVFEQMRAAHRLSTSELLDLVKDPNNAHSPQARSLNFSREAAEGCLALVPKGTAAPTLEELQEVLPVVETEQWPEARQFQELVQLAVADLDSLHAVVLALHILTRRLAEFGLLLESTQQELQQEAAAAGTESMDVSPLPSTPGPRTLKKGSEKWAHLLMALFHKAIENMSLSYGLAIRNRKRKRPGGNNKSQEDDVALFEAYCRQYGFWVSSSSYSSPAACYPLEQVVWSLEDPIARYVTTASTSIAAAAGEEHAACVALDKEVNGLLETEEEEEGTSDMVRRFFTDSLRVSGERFRGKFVTLLREALERWSRAPGPMPRDVEALYRTLASTTTAGIAGAVASGSGAGGGVGVSIKASTSFSFSEIPVLNMNLNAATLAVLSPAAAAIAASAASSSSGAHVLHLRTNGSGSSSSSNNLVKGGAQPLVGVAGSGDSDDGALDWFYRKFFPSRCLHPAIFSLFKLASPALLPRLALAKPRPSFLESYADSTSSMVSVLRAMNVDAVNVAKLLGELYAGPTLPRTELARYWANVTELRDLVLTEIWKAKGLERNEELIEAARTSLKLPLCAKPPTACPGAGGGVWGLEATVTLVNALQSAEAHAPVYLGSLLGIDLELQDKQLEEIPRLVKHPGATRDSSWHRASRAEDGFRSVEQGCYWERFLLALGVVPLTEAHLPLISTQVLNKVFLALAKFNALLNSSEPTVASQYNIWQTYHALFRLVDGNMYISRYTEIRAAASAAADGGAAGAARQAIATGAAAALTNAQQQEQQQQQQQVQQQQQAQVAQAAATGGGFPYPYGASALPPATSYLPAPTYAFPPAPSAYGTAPPPPPPPPEVHSGFAPPPVKRQRSQMSSSSSAAGGGEGNSGAGAAGAAGGGGASSPTPDGESATKTPRLVPPVPPLAPSPVQQEEGEVEEGEIED